MKIFVVEDDRLFNSLIANALKKEKELVISTFFNGGDLIRHLSEHPEVITLDIGLPDYFGLDLLGQIKRLSPSTEVIVISGHDDLKLAVQMLKLGAYDYIAKDENVRERLLHCISHIRSKFKISQELSKLRSEISERYYDFEEIVGESRAMKRALALMEKASRMANVNVLLCGEEGTGKGMISRAIHYNSERAAMPFVSFSVGAVPPGMIREELFGVEDLRDGEIPLSGKIAEAANGTLFIEDSTVDLAEEVRARRFREDLYFRLMGIPVYLPSLRERKKDIILLAGIFLTDFCNINGMDKKELSAAANRKLLKYPYPGNVRELKAVIELAAVLTDSTVIDEEHIVFNSTASVADFFSEEMTMKQYSDKIIRHYLEKYHNDVKTVAAKLDIGKSTIYNLLKKWEEQGE
jgi:DNA-binding NtrC family response regulator